MYTSIAEVPTQELRDGLSAIFKHQKENDHSPESLSMGVTIGNLALSSKQIGDELGDRKTKRDEKYRNFQWDIHHLAEDCIMTLGPEDGDAIDRLTAGIAQFRVEFGIRSCTSCR